ncbi:MAG: phage tail assembly protein T [Moraxella sp.]
MTVRQLCEQMPEDELIEWMAYDSIDPIGNYRSDVQTALLAYMQAGDKNATLDDFILFDPDPITDEERVQQEEEQRKTQLKQQADAMQEYFLYLKRNNNLPDG